MHTIELHVGRLLECRIASPIELSEVQMFRQALGAIFAKLEGHAVIAVDLRGANVFPQDVADGFLAVMRADNPRIERSGLVCGASAMFSMQVERLVREAANPKRRAFHQSDEAIGWLSEVLDEAERRRLQSFLGR